MPDGPEQNPYAKIYADAMKQAPPPAAAGAAPAEAPQQSMMQQMGTGVENLGKGALKGIANTSAGIGTMEHALFPQSLRNTGYGKDFEEGLDTLKSAAVPHGTMQSLGKGAEQMAEFFLPGPAEASIAEKLPLLGKFAKPVAQMLGAEGVNEAQGGTPGMGAAGSAAGQGVAAGMKAAAPYAAETAMRIPGVAKAFGRTPGRAILEDTSGILPSTVGRTAQETTNRLTPEVERMAAASGTPMDLGPARGMLDDAAAKAVRQNASTLHGQITPMSDFLSKRFDTGAAIPSQVPAADGLDLKRGFGEEFGRWNPDMHKSAVSTGRQAYHELADAFHEAVPGAAESDQRVSSLIPVIRAADKAERAPSMLQRTAGRVGAHTGALAGAGIGATLGYREGGGWPGAVVGGVTGLVAPELMASPESQMMAARTLGSKTLQGAAPAAGAATMSRLKSLRDYLRESQ